MSIITEELIDQALATPGWSAFEDLTKKAAGDTKRLMDAARNEAGVVAEGPATPEGRKFLHWLMQKTLLRPPAEQELAAASAEQYAIAKARREGQNGVAFMILHALDVAQTGMAPNADRSGGDVT